MSEASKSARKAAKSKVERLVRADPRGTPIDASGYTPPDALDADVKTGMRPVSKRQFKRGGKVLKKAEGHKNPPRADRKPRKDGGSAMPPVDRLINRDLKKANEYRDGDKHIGGMKKGGKVKKMGGGPIGPNVVSQDMLQNARAAMPMGRKHGGKAKREHHAGLDGNVVGKDAINKFINTQTGKPITPAEIQFADKSGNIPLPPRRQYQSTDDLVRNAPQSYRSVDDLVNAMPRKHGGKAEKWIQKAIKHPGSLHKALHVPAGEKIPAKKLEKASHSDNPNLARKANLAKTLKGMHHAHGGKAEHPDEAEDKKLIKKMIKPEAIKHRAHGGNIMEETGVRPTGGRIARKAGGRAKGKTNVNIVIAQHPAGAMGNPQQPQMPPRPPQGVPVPPPMPPAGMMPSGGAPMGGMMPPGGMPPMGAGGPMGARPPMPQMAMARKSGGKVYRTINDMDAGAGGGKGRLEKIEIYGGK
jgi:hypothetical protein